MSSMNTMTNLPQYGFHTRFINSMKTAGALVNLKDKSCTSEGARRYGGFATGVAQGTKSMRNSTCRCGGNPDKSSRNTSAKSRTTEISLNFGYPNYLLMTYYHKLPLGKPVHSHNHIKASTTQRMPPKDSTSETPAINFRFQLQMIADHTTAMEAQTAAICKCLVTPTILSLLGTPTSKNRKL
ncbi:hypothetical protein Tco_1508695 [Tanacetum coccineum]